MIIKKHSNNSLPFLIYKSLSSPLFKFVGQKKIPVILIIFIIGMLAGIILFSQSTQIKLMAKFVLPDTFRPYLRSIRDNGVTTTGLNFLNGRLSDPEQIYIDIKLEDYQKLALQREEALKMEVLLAKEQSFVPATIQYKDKTMMAELRLKGDLIDHINTDKWSFRIKLKEDNTLFGMKVFSIHHPKIRNWVNEIIYQYAMKREGIVSLTNMFIEVFINGESKGVYELEEHFDKRLIENNAFREGPIIKLNEEIIWVGDVYEAPRPDAFKNNDHYYFEMDISSFQENRIMKNPMLYTQFIKAKSLFESFREGKLNASEVFDTKKVAKYFALSELLGASHGLLFTNARFYYNPITSRLEPIAFDGYAGLIEPYLMAVKMYGVPMKNYHAEFFKDLVFFEEYVKQLERVSDPAYLGNLFDEIDKDLKESINIIHKDDVSYSFSKEPFYRNQELIRRYLNPINVVQSYFLEKKPETIVVETANIQVLPVKIERILYNNSIVFEPKEDYILEPKILGGPSKYEKLEFILPKGEVWSDNLINDLKINYKIVGTSKLENQTVFKWAHLDKNFLETDIIRQKPNMWDFEFISVNEADKIIHLKDGYWVLDKNLIIPAGYTIYCDAGMILDFKNNATILSYSPMKCIGSAETPIQFISSDSTGYGVLVLDADATSTFVYTIFDNLAAPSYDGLALTGVVTFYQSPVDFNHVYILNSRLGDDSLNIIRTRYSIDNSLIKNGAGDCFDNDFAEGVVSNSIFSDCGNDGVDISGASSYLNNSKIINVGDKGVSVGEQGQLIINNLLVNGSLIGLASKDNSHLITNSVIIANSKYGLAAYQKKPEFGPASINAKDITLINIKMPMLCEEKSTICIDGKKFSNYQKNVYNLLYPGAE